MFSKKCRECALHKKCMHNCEDCNIDFDNQNDILQILHSTQIGVTANTIINNHKNGLETVRHKNSFYIVGNNSKSCNRGHLWEYIDIDNDKVLHQKDITNKNATFKRLEYNKKKSRNRALDNFLNYGQNNDFDYFVTLTFNPKNVQSDDSDVIKACWRSFKQKLQYYFKDIKLLFVIEYHKNEQRMHFHGVIGNADLSKFLVRGIDNRPFKKSKEGLTLFDEKGNPILNPHYLLPIQTDLQENVYNFSTQLYDLGFTTVIPLKDRQQDYTVYEKIVFYLCKYMSKEKSAIPFSCKSYFHTSNLQKGVKYSLALTDEEFEIYSNARPSQYLKKTNSEFASFYERKLNELLICN